jgi:hypothetical protein
MEWSISETNRGKKSLLYDGFTYRIDSLLKSGDISWRCTLKTCKARLRTESKLLISANTEHNHDTDARKVERQQIHVSVKRKANNDIAERPSKLIRSELQTGEEQHLTDNDLRYVVTIAVPMYTMQLFKEFRTAFEYPINENFFHLCTEYTKIRSAGENNDMGIYIIY